MCACMTVKVYGYAYTSPSVLSVAAVGDVVFVVVVVVVGVVVRVYKNKNISPAFVVPVRHVDVLAD